MPLENKNLGAFELDDLTLKGFVQEKGNTRHVHGRPIDSQSIISSGDKLFPEVFWESLRTLSKKAEKHSELYQKDILEKVRELGSSKPNPFVHAYIYKNNYSSNRPAEKRSSGDVLMINEKDGVMAAFSEDGTVKAARIGDPVELRNYLLDERHRDIGSNP